MFGYRIPSLKQIIPLSLIALALPILIAVLPTPAVFSQGESPAEIQAEPQAEIIIRDRGAITTNTANFNRVEYVGQCPGINYAPSELEARFISPTTPPAPGRRVIIRNVTKGLDSDPFPFTDREYSQDRYSERFDLEIDYEHRLRSFSTIAGENQLEYEIKEEDGRIIERGTLTLQVSISDRGFFARDRVCREEWKCAQERRGDRTDRICRPFRTCSCPS